MLYGAGGVPGRASFLILLALLPVSPDGRFLVTFRYTREAQLWSMEDGSPLGDPVEGLTATLKAHFSPDSSVMALKRLDVEELQVIATVDGRRVSTLPTESGFGDYTFSPDGRTLVSSSPYSDARLWDVTSGQQIGKPLTGTAVSRRESGSQAQFHVTYSRDGRTLATTAGSRAQQLRLWNVADASPVGPVLYGHTDPVNDIEFTPDGRTLASGSDDRTVRLWRVQGTGPGPQPDLALASLGAGVNQLRRSRAPHIARVRCER
ncbi:WD40 repeat domain-containing protein [Streptomyces goshikiensis]